MVFKLDREFYRTHLFELFKHIDKDGGGYSYNVAILYTRC